MTSPADDVLLGYLAQRDAHRAEAAAAIWTDLTDRERGLIHDAAVMGYVQGMRHPTGERIPKDSRITYIVVDACRAFPDLYPTITGYQANEGEQR